MKYLIEAVIYAAVYFLFLVILFRKQGAVKQLGNYPPSIQERAIKLGLTTKEKMTEETRKSKIIGFTLLIILNFIIILGINHEKTFLAGFLESWVFLNAFSLADALCMDTIWFCHGRFWIIPGTEDMTDAYHDYWFHWKYFFGGLVGMMPLNAVIGILVLLIGKIA